MGWSKGYGDNKDAITIGPWEDNKWNVEEEDEEEEEEEQWDDGIFTTVRKFIVSHGSKVTAIQIEYDKDGRSVWSETHGEVGGGKVDIIVLDYPNEFLTAIGGCFGSFPGVLKSLTFYSNRCKYGPYGEDLEEVFICRAANAKIVGFHGKTGPNLKSIGVHLKLDNNYRDPCVGTSDERGGDSNNKKVYNHDQSIVPETVQHERRETTSAQMADTFEGLRLAAEKLTALVAAQALTVEKDNFRKCMEVLQEIKLLDKEFKAAINFLRDDMMAIAFLAIKGPRRRTWLLSSIENMLPPY